MTLPCYLWNLLIVLNSAHFSKKKLVTKSSKNDILSAIRIHNEVSMGILRSIIFRNESNILRITNNNFSFINYIILSRDNRKLQVRAYARNCWISQQRSTHVIQHTRIVHTISCNNIMWRISFRFSIDTFFNYINLI